MSPAKAMHDPARAAPAWRGALVCALVAALLRLAVILMPPADLSWGGHVWNEEWLRGNVAWEILHGPVVPLRDHAVGLWGGTIVVGVLAVPMFAIFGPVLPALRIACLPFPMIEAAAGFVLLHRLAGARAAWAGGLMLAIAPPGPVLDSVLAQGTHQHLHALVLGWLVLTTWLRERGGAPFAHGLVGASVGLLLYFGGGVLLALAVGLDLILDRAWWREPKLVAARVSGFVLGCAPLLLARAQSPEKPLGIYGRGPAGLAFGGGEEPWSRLVSLFGRDIPDAFWVRGEAGFGIGLAWMLALLALWCLAVWTWRKERDPAHVALLCYPPVFVAIWAMSPLERGSEDHIVALRYMLPLISVLAITGGLAIERIGREHPRTGVAICAAFLVLALGTLAPKLEPSAAGANWRTPGARPQGVARIHLWRNGADPVALESFLARIAERRSPSERDALLRELDLLVDNGARARTRVAERGEPGEDPAPWWAALERLRREER